MIIPTHQRMSEEERRDWLDMKRTMADYLPTLERHLIEFATNGDDEYDFLVKKAIEQ